MSVQWTGLEEFRTALRNLPSDLAQEAGAIVIAHAEFAKQEIQASYPEGPTGNLKRGVTIEKQQAGPFAAVAIVRSRAPHATIYEKGTAQRRTAGGANRGSMPAAPPSQQFIPIAIRARRRMVAALIQLLQRAGLVVTES